MIVAVELNGTAELPFPTVMRTVQQLVNIVHETRHIDDGMTAENMGQAVGQAAGKAFARALRQSEEKLQAVILESVIVQPDVIGPFTGIPEKGFEKLVCPFGVKEGFQAVRRKKGFK